MKKLYMGRDSRGANLYRIETDRGAFVRYEIENRRACIRSLVEIWAPRLLIAGGILYFIMFGLPGDPLHGASKYQAKSCAGLIECAQEWGEDGGENKEEEAVTVYDYRGRA